MRALYKKRFLIYGAVMAVLFCVLTVRLVNLQIRSSDAFSRNAEVKKTKTIITHGDRGLITDVNGKILADNKKVYDVKFYRDPNWNPNRDSSGNLIPGSNISALERYTAALLEAIRIVEKYGGTVIEGFALQYVPEPEVEGEHWVFEWGDVKDSVKEKREELWRSNFFLKSTPQQELFDKLCTNYRIPASLPMDKKLQVLTIWQEMQMNAFLSVPITIARDVRWETVIELETRTLKLNGISIEVNAQRIYPNGTHMSHVIGYIGKIQNTERYVDELQPKGYQLNDLIGLDGIEKSMEDTLTASSLQRRGSRVVEIDRYGAINRELYNIQPENGNNVKLTIDSALQYVAEIALANNIEQIREFQESEKNNPRWLDSKRAILESNERDYEKFPFKLAEKGALVVVDMQGRVLSLASYPPYDPNAFIVGGQPAVDILLDPRNVLMNNSIASLATPGSIFKMVTASAAMAFGQLDPFEKISDEGPYTAHDQSNPPRCWIDPKKISQHKDQTIVEGLEHSCNFFFYTIADRIGGDALYKYAALYGLTSSTRIDLPGELKSYVGNQLMLYDPNKAISAAEQATWTPTLVASSIRAHLQRIAKERNMTFNETKLDSAITRLMKMAVAEPQFISQGEGKDPLNNWVRNIRAILMEELDMPREMVYLQVVVGDIFIMLNEVKWGGNQTIMTAIGQSITMLTPVAVARYVAAVANGGDVYDLTIIDSITSPEGELISQRAPVLINQMPELSPYLPYIQLGMKGVVDEEGGTATSYFRGFKYVDDMAGKSGTAQVSKIDLENNAWFVAYAPFENPEIAVVCYIPNGYSGSRASLAVRDVIGYYMDQRQETAQEYMPAANALAY